MSWTYLTTLSAMATMRTYGDRCGDRARARRDRRALGAAGGARARARAEALQRPARRAAAASAPTCSPSGCASSRQAGRRRAARRSPPPRGARVYELTERGQELEPLVLGLGPLGRAARRSRAARRDARRRRVRDRAQDAVRPARRVSRDVSTLRLGDDRFRARRPATGASRPRGAPPRIRTSTIDADPGALAAVLWHGAPARRASSVLGDVALFDLFRALLPGAGARPRAPARARR